MGKKDIIQKLYTEDNRIFADIVNFMLYDGREVICPEDLEELSCEQVMLAEREDFHAEKEKNGKHRSAKYIGLQRYRDVQKRLVIRQAKDTVYVLICLENQSEVHYAMPIRNMLNDALNYVRQVETLSKQHFLKAKDLKAGNFGTDNSQTGTSQTDNSETENLQKSILETDNSGIKISQTGISQTDNSETENLQTSILETDNSQIDIHNRNRKEFLSGIHKEDKLLPVISFVLLFQDEEWDGPISVHEMLCTDDPAILRYVQDYKLNLIVPAELTEEALKKFHSSLREVLSFIKYSKDKEQMNCLIEENFARFSRMEKEAVAVINLFTGTNIEIREEEEVIDMCKAWEDMRAEGIKVGQEEGIKAGRIEGIKVGRAEGIKVARTENRKKQKRIVQNMVDRGYSIEDIMAIMECSREELQELIG